jgi:hypothetical protein
MSAPASSGATRAGGQPSRTVTAIGEQLAYSSNVAYQARVFQLSLELMEVFVVVVGRHCLQTISFGKDDRQIVIVCREAMYTWCSLGYVEELGYWRA